MTLIELVIVLVVIGVVLYLLNLIPMDATIRLVIRIVVIVAVVIWLIKALGLLNWGPKIGALFGL